MPFGINPFSKNDKHEYPGVVVPLSSAPANSKTSPDPEKKVGPQDTDAASLDRSSSAENGVGSIHSHQQGQDGHLTLEILRAEVENDLVASGQDSAYDRTFNLRPSLEEPILFRKIPCFVSPTPPRLQV
jgi:hypothetical protein